VIQDVDPVGDRHPRRLQVPKRRRNRSLGQVVPQIVVESDGQDARVVTFYGHDQVVQSGEVFVVPGQYRAVLSDGPGEHPSIANRYQPDVRGEYDVVPCRL
jgi:hypothetical protein